MPTKFHQKQQPTLFVFLAHPASRVGKKTKLSLLVNCQSGCSLPFLMKFGRHIGQRFSTIFTLRTPSEVVMNCVDPLS